MKCPVKIALSTAPGYSNSILFSLGLERTIRVRTLCGTKHLRTFKDIFPIFQGIHSVQKRALSLTPFWFYHKHEQFYPEGPSY